MSLFTDRKFSTPSAGESTNPMGLEHWAVVFAILGPIGGALATSWRLSEKLTRQTEALNSVTKILERLDSDVRGHSVAHGQLGQQLVDIERRLRGLEAH